MGDIVSGLRFEERRQESLREEAKGWVSESRQAVQAELVGTRRTVGGGPRADPRTVTATTRLSGFLSFVFLN